MKKIVLILFLGLFSLASIAEENCVDCQTRNQTSGQLKFSGTNTGDLSQVTTKVRRTIASEKINPELLELVCLFMEDLDFPGILELLAEQNLKFEDVYSQFKCKASRPTLMHYVVDMPQRYGTTISRMLVYFDGVKVKDPTFDYGSILNIKNVYIDSKGEKDVTTLLDWIDRSMPEHSQASKDRLARVRESLVERGALPAARLSSRLP